MFIKQTHQKQKPRSSLITRLTTLALALILSISSLPATQLNVQAGVGGVNGGDDLDHEYKGSDTTGGQIYWTGVVGYRFYIVNSNFNCVSTMYDFINGFNASVPVIYESQAPMGQEYTKVAPKGYYRSSLDTLQALCNASEKPPIPYNLKGGYGDEFYEWFFNGKDGYSDLGSTIERPTTPSTGTPSSGGSSGTGGTSGGSGTSNGSSTTDGSSGGSTTGSTPPSQNQIETSAIIREYALTTARQGQDIANDCYAGGFEGTTEYNDYHEDIDALAMWKSEDYGIWYKQAINQWQFDSYTARNYALQMVKSSITGDKYTNTAKNYIARTAMAYYVTYGNAGTMISSTRTSNKATGNLLTQSIPLAGNTENGLTPARNLLGKVGIWNINGYTDALQALQDELNPHYLIVEPLGSYSVNGNSGYTHEAGEIFGSFYNICDYWTKSTLSGKSNSGGWMNNVMKQQYISLKTRSDFPNLLINGNTVKNANTTYSGSQNIPRYLEEMKSGLGYGLQVYSGFAEAGTHTWDSSTHPDTPGPAPDPTLLNDDETNKTVVIIKNYVTLDTTDPANPVEKVDGNYIRTLNPHQITIEDEPGPGYKVIAWETSTEPTPPTFNPTTPYEELTKKSNSIQSGTTPTTVLTLK